MSVNMNYRRMNAPVAFFAITLSLLCSAASPLMAQQTAEPPANVRRRSETEVLKRTRTAPGIPREHNQKQVPESASGVFEISGDVGLTILNLDLPDALELTPTHPNDVDPLRPERSQRTTLGTNAVPVVGISIKIRPLQVSGLRNLSIGYRAAFPFTVNDFRQGPFSTRKPYRVFIGGEEAYTYMRLANLGPISEFRLAYGIPLRKSVELDIGVKYSLYRLTIKQGWDRFNQDEVFRTTKGKNDSLSPTIGVNFAIGKDNWITLGLEIERGKSSFEGIGRDGSIRGGSPYFRVSRRF